jgi:hypothetical protein
MQIHRGHPENAGPDDNPAGDFPGGPVGFYLFLILAVAFGLIVTAVQWAGRLLSLPLLAARTTRAIGARRR